MGILAKAIDALRPRKRLIMKAKNDVLEDLIREGTQQIEEDKQDLAHDLEDKRAQGNQDRFDVARFEAWEQHQIRRNESCLTLYTDLKRINDEELGVTDPSTP